jgi:hypothetical protein
VGVIVGVLVMPPSGVSVWVGVGVDVGGVPLSVGVSVAVAGVPETVGVGVPVVVEVTSAVAEGV